MNTFSFFLTFTLAVISAVTFGVDVWINYKSAMNYDIGRISDDNVTQIQPANWIFMIWTIIYALFAIWYVYVFLLLLRQLCSGRNKSPLFPGIFWFLFIIINVLNGLWIHLYVQNYMVITGIILVVLTLMLYLINIIAFRVCWMDVTYDKSNNDNNDNNDVERNNDDIIELPRCDVGLLRFTTLNGLPLYAIWCTVACALQWTMIFQYRTFHWNGSLASVLTLSILSVVLLFYWLMDLVTLRKYFVYTWLPCFALIAAFASILERNNSLGGQHRPGLTFVFVLLIVSVAMTLLKSLTLCCCPPKYDNPRFSRV